MGFTEPTFILMKNYSDQEFRNLYRTCFILVSKFVNSMNSLVNENFELLIKSDEDFTKYYKKLQTDDARKYVGDVYNALLAFDVFDATKRDNLTEFAATLANTKEGESLWLFIQKQEGKQKKLVNFNGLIRDIDSTISATFEKSCQQIDLLTFGKQLRKQFDNDNSL